MTYIKVLLLVGALFFVSGCSTESAEKPVVTPLQVSGENLAKLYGINKGDFEFSTIDTELTFDGRELPLRIWAPEVAGKYPLLLFSHGNWSDHTKYNNVIEHWVSHGYVVIAPYHLDAGGMARGIFNSLRYGQLGLIESRANELSYIIDNIDQLGTMHAQLRGKIDASKIAATGHSFGAYSAQQLIGASAFDEDLNKHVFFEDKRITSVVAISPPGEMFDVIVQDSWRQVSKPMLVTTGTWDSNPQFWPDWQAHKLSFDTAKTGSNYALVVQGADHYLGNLICRPEREEPPQHDALTMVNSASVTFLDASLKQLPTAIAALGSNNMADITQGFAVVERR